MIPSENQLRLSFRPYRRQFKMPLRVAWGVWQLREGIILKLEDQESGRTGYGEIAPLEPFGTESIEVALRHVFALQRIMTISDLETSIADAPAASAFGLRSALQSLQVESRDLKPVRTSALVHLDSLDASLDVLRSHGTSVFKVKIGIQPAREEQAQLEKSIAALKSGEILRLDPNQGWDLTIWKDWQSWITGVREHIQFIEEPFNPDSVSTQEMLSIAGESPVPLALDESLSRSVIQTWIDSDWPGYWIIKPSLQGDPTKWCSILKDPDKVILSSAFETGIGLTSILRLAARFQANDHGLGTGAYFDDKLGISARRSSLTPLPIEQMESIWNNLPDH